MTWHKEELDVILIPAGLMIMFGYHLFLAYRYLRSSKNTVLGLENKCRKIWVKKLMQLDSVNRGPAFTMMNGIISAANFMASTSLTLNSLIGAWVGSSSSNKLVADIIYGDKRTSIASIKYISILLFFLLAFMCFIQSSRCNVHAILLLSMPRSDVDSEEKMVEALTVEALIHGANFWQAGLRAIYFAITMLMWIFGPIPMFVSSVVMMVSLYVLDISGRNKYEFKESTRKISDQRAKSMGKGVEQHAKPDSNSELHATAVNTTVLYTAVSNY